MNYNSIEISDGHRQLALGAGALTIEQVERVCSNPSVMLAINPSTIDAVNAAERFMNSRLDSEIIYGANTGFGPMAGHLIDSGRVKALQRNLVLSHAVGVGAPIRQDYILAAMLIRLHTFLLGKSGVSETLVNRLVKFINFRIVPVVPEHGAVGTSGDLVQLAHIALGLIGEGEVFFRGKRRAAADALKELDMRSYSLGPKEGLALINGTAMMAAVSAIVHQEARRLLDYSLLNGALSLQLVSAFEDCIARELHELRPHSGQKQVASSLRELVAGSKLLRKRSDLNGAKSAENNGRLQVLDEQVQNVYSIRCIPQILGPTHEVLEKLKSVVETEINSVTDNPAVNVEGQNFLHGGNFHGDYVAQAVDFAKIAIIKLTMLSERRLNYFLHKGLNKHLPPFLNLDVPGISLGLQGLQFVATSTTAQSQTLAFPQYIHSIPTNADNQDVVSMGTDAALLAAKVVDNAHIVLCIEALGLSQAVEALSVYEELSPPTREHIDNIRSACPVIRKDEDVTRAVTELRKALPLGVNQDG